MWVHFVASATIARETLVAAAVPIVAAVVVESEEMPAPG